jgi:putative ATP-binding cassette transporter
MSAAAFTDDQIREVLTAVGLPALADRLDIHAHWNRTLSLGEQQRLGLCRALLMKPRYLFLDEATASLDEASEETLYRLLAERLPDTAMVSTGHRATLNAFHARTVKLVRKGGHFAIEPGAPAAV